MIQRIQSIFIALVAILMGVGPGFSNYFIIGPGDNSWVYLNYFGKVSISSEGQTTFHYWPYIIVSVLSFIACTIAVIEFFKFKDRMLQLKLGAINSLFMVGTVVAMFIFTYELRDEISFAPGAFKIGFFFPPAAMFCNIIANFFIRKDEKLVRSADRMR